MYGSRFLMTFIGYRQDGSPYLSLEDRARHLHVIGQTGTGKSTLSTVQWQHLQIVPPRLVHLLRPHLKSSVILFLAFLLIPRCLFPRRSSRAIVPTSGLS